LYFYFNKGGSVFKRYGTIKYVHRILFCHERVYIQIDVREVALTTFLRFLRISQTAEADYHRSQTIRAQASVKSRSAKS